MKSLVRRSDPRAQFDEPGPAGVALAQGASLEAIRAVFSTRAEIPLADVMKTGRKDFNMELDKAFEFAMISAWEDLMKVTKLSSAQVEYRCEPGTSLDHLSVWLVKGRGYLDLVCDYWTQSSSAHPSGVRFRNGHCSDKLAQTLAFIMKHQDRFTRPADAARNGLVKMYPPAGDDQAGAATWIREVTTLNFGGSAG